MPTSRIRTSPAAADAVHVGLDRIRADLDVPGPFPDPVTLEAEHPEVHTADPGRVDRRDLPLVTIDPPGSMDLDQALAIEADADGGHVVWYAIADVAAFVRPGGAIDAEARARAVTLYAPDGRSPLHPPALSEGAASLLPALDRPAVLWRLGLDPDGMLVSTTVGRAVVRSREQLTYAQAQQRIDGGDPLLAPLAVVGRRRQEAEAARGGVSLPVPDQEVTQVSGGYVLRFDQPLPVEGWNAQLSLLCGIAAADLMLAGGWGILRTLPVPDDHTLATLRRHALALGIDWPAGVSYAELIRSLDMGRAAAAAFVVQATRLFRGADYRPLGTADADEGEGLVHAAIASPYAHVTAPLRRLVDRFATEAVLAIVAGDTPPAWVVDALDELPGLMRAGTSKASALDRAVVDLMEAVVLADRVGERFAGVVVDQRRNGAVVQLRDPAVVAVVEEDIPLGSEVTVVVEGVDVTEWTVRFRLA